jgi:SlyX protein
MSEDRLIEIESKLAHQDQLLFELNEVVTEQQARIMQLEHLSTSLLARIREIGDTAADGSPRDEQPPHY